MKRKRILTQYLLYFLMLMFLLVGGCSSGGDDDDDAAPAVDYWITVSGTVTTAGGTPVSGVMMQTMYQLELLNVNLWEGSINSDLFNWILTDSSGNYSITVPAGLVENYTLVITPVKKSYTFTPANRVLTIAGVDQAGVNFTATQADEFSQSDLTGIWRVKMLRAGTENQWLRSRISVAATGVATCLSYETSDSAGDTTCPVDFELTLTMGTGDDDGVITQSGAYAAGTNHMTMNSDKDFAAGTGTSGTSYQIVIAQKDEVPIGAQTSQYIGSELNSRNFVFHSLRAGGTNEWRYGAGATTSTSTIAMATESTPTAPLGTAAMSLDGYTFAVDVNGVVTIADAIGAPNNFEGFLSIDERTIVGNFTDATGDLQMIVIQLIDNQIASSMTGTSVNHLLAVADGETPAWAYHDVNISRFETSFLPDILGLTFALDMMLSYNWELSLGYTPLQKLGLIDLERINITANGQATIEDPASTEATPLSPLFHGQLAFDGTFMVGVETITLDGNPFFALDVITH